MGKHRGRWGVEPICTVLQVAPSTFYAALNRPRSARALRDDVLLVEIGRVFDENYQVYGVRKIWRQLGREGFVVARCTVARLMKRLGIAAVPQSVSALVRVSVDDWRHVLKLVLDFVVRDMSCLEFKDTWRRWVGSIGARDDGSGSVLRSGLCVQGEACRPD